MADFTDAQYFLNRECTWVKFNERVLREAIVPSNPLLEQLNFIAFSHYLGDIAGQVFVFFILTVAASETAIGLGILVVLFRRISSVKTDDLDSLKG